MIAFRSNLTAKINIKIQKQFTQLQRIKNVGSQRGPTNAAAVASNMWHPSMTCIHIFPILCWSCSKFPLLVCMQPKKKFEIFIGSFADYNIGRMLPIIRIYI